MCSEYFTVTVRISGYDPRGSCSLIGSSVSIVYYVGLDTGSSIVIHYTSIMKCDGRHNLNIK